MKTISRRESLAALGAVSTILAAGSVPAIASTIAEADDAELFAAVAEFQAVWATFGKSETDDEVDATIDAWNLALDRIGDTPARTLQGIAAKLRIANKLGSDERTEYKDSIYELTESVTTDIDRMAEGARP